MPSPYLTPRLRARGAISFPPRMHVAFHLAVDLDTALQTAAATAGLADAAAFTPEVRSADPKHGDFQANGTLGYAKARKLNPRATAEQLVSALPAVVRETYDVSIAGPGFINFTLKPAALHAWLRTFATREALAAGAAAAHTGQTWVVDYSSPNTAKQMHVGHLRSAVIGEAICRLLAFTGARVIRDNHLGDWGTQFGKLIYGYKRWADPTALAADPIEELERLYKLGHAATPDDSPAIEEARRELVAHQDLGFGFKFLEGELHRGRLHFEHRAVAPPAQNQLPHRPQPQRLPLASSPKTKSQKWCATVSPFPKRNTWCLRP